MPLHHIYKQTDGVWNDIKWARLGGGPNGFTENVINLKASVWHFHTRGSNVLSENDEREMEPQVFTILTCTLITYTPGLRTKCTSALQTWMAQCVKFCDRPCFSCSWSMHTQALPCEHFTKTRVRKVRAVKMWPSVKKLSLPHVTLQHQRSGALDLKALWPRQDKYVTWWNRHFHEWAGAKQKRESRESYQDGVKSRTDSDAKKQKDFNEQWTKGRRHSRKCLNSGSPTTTNRKPGHRCAP